MGEKTANVEPHDAHGTEIDFELPAHGSQVVISTLPEALRDNPTHTPATPKTPQPQAPAEPKMGATRTVDGQKQVYFLPCRMPD